MASQYARSISTFIKNLYSPGYSTLMISFFNTNISFYFTPWVSKDAMGRNSYDSKKNLVTTTGYEGAFSLYKVACDIVDGKEAADGALLNSPCAGGASLTLERRPGQDGQMETLLTIYKNDTFIPFKFGSMAANSVKSRRTHQAA